MKRGHGRREQRHASRVLRSGFQNSVVQGPDVASIPTPCLESWILEPSIWLGGLVSLVLVGWLGALAFGVPDLTAVVAAPAVLLVYGAITARSEPVTLSLSIDRDRAFEGELVTATLLVNSHRYWRRVVCDISLTPCLRPEEPPARFALYPGPRGEARASITLLCKRWGEHQIGPVSVRTYSRIPLYVGKGVFRSATVVRVRPASLPIRAGIVPSRTQVHVGSQLARERAQGLEFADIRQYLPGDSVRSINWRVTARQRKTYVNLHQPDRNSDVMIFLDTFTDLGTTSSGSLALAGRVAATLAEFHLRSRRDRVGLLLYGGVLQWLAPSSGMGQLHRIVDTIIEARVVPSYTRPAIAVIPPRVLPPQSLVIAISPLVEPRTIQVLAGIRARRFDLAILEIDPESYVGIGAGGQGPEVAERVWRLWRAARRAELLRTGIRVVRWDPTTPLDQPIFAINQLTRQRWTSGV